MMSQINSFVLHRYPVLYPNGCQIKYIGIEYRLTKCHQSAPDLNLNSDNFNIKFRACHNNL